jgi:hypothetical protein
MGIRRSGRPEVQCALLRGAGEMPGWGAWGCWLVGPEAEAADVPPGLSRELGRVEDTRV